MENRKRKPLSDITNTYNLISTPTLRKLVSSSNSNSNSVLKPPITVLKSGSSSRKLELYSDSSPTVNGTDAKSDTSIGSSNVDSALRTRTVRFQTPEPSVLSIISGEGGNKDVNGPRKPPDKLKKQTESFAVSDTSTSGGTRNGKGKTVAVPLDFPPPVEKKNAEIAISKSCSQRKTDENHMDKFVLGNFEKIREFGQGIFNPSSCTNGKMEKGKAILDYSGCTEEKTESRGKQLIYFFNPSYDLLKRPGKEIFELPGSSTQKTEDTRKAMDKTASIIFEKTVGKEKSLKSFGSYHDKTSDKGKTILNPLNKIEITSHKGASAASLTINLSQPRKKNEKRKKDTGASSCTPMRKIKKMQNDLEIAGIVKSSKLKTVASPKSKKKRCNQPTSAEENCLPPDFIEQQRAYFKEVDDFILAEEETSQNELE